jgi:hypothetical protein
MEHWAASVRCRPAGLFDLRTTFPLNSTSSVFAYNPAFTSNFGAGSPVGSYIVFGQTTPLPPPSVPESASFGLLGVMAVHKLLPLIKSARSAHVERLSSATGSVSPLLHTPNIVRTIL